MSAVRPHQTDNTGKPDTCPVCGQPYQYRLRASLDDYPLDAHYRHGYRRHVYVHQIDLAQAAQYHWSLGGDSDE